MRSIKSIQSLPGAFLTILLLLALTAPAGISAGDTGTVKKHKEIHKEKFLALYLRHFKRLVCADEGQIRQCISLKEKCEQGAGIFRRCFSLNRQQCEQSVETTGTACGREIGGHMPKVIKSAHDSGKWGGKIALCIKKRFTLQHRNQLSKQTSICKSLLPAKAAK